MMPSALVISAKGIGDGLLMMIAAQRLFEKGYDVALFHEKADLLQPLFDIEITNSMREADLYLCQNDNGKRAWNLLRKRPDNCHFLFPKPSKMEREIDFSLDQSTPMATSIASVMEILLDVPLSTCNGIKKPQGAEFQKHKKRVIIHPTSGDTRKNWRRNQFLELERLLKKDGFDPIFVVSESESKDWNGAYISKSLSELSKLLYESGYFIGNDSGVGHLASNLGLPTLTISGNTKIAKQWRPNFHHNVLSLVPFPLPNFKGIGLPIRDKCWQSFLRPKRVLADFHNLVHSLIP